MITGDSCTFQRGTTISNPFTFNVSATLRLSVSELTDISSLI